MIKDLICLVSRASGLNAWLRHGRRHHLLTVCYHNVQPAAGIRDTFGFRNTISTVALERQLEILGSYFTFVAPDAVRRAVAGEPLPPGAVLVTFDDGYASNLEHAAPVMQRLGVPGVFHVCTGVVGRTAPLWYEELAWILEGWQRPTLPLPTGAEVAVVTGTGREEWLLGLAATCKALPDGDRRAWLDTLRELPWREPEKAERAAFRKLDWDEVRALAAQGFGVGSHTVNHPILSRLAATDLQHELTASRREIEHELDQPCPFLAYPNGRPSDVSPAVITAAADAGYEIGFTTTQPFSRPQVQPLAVGRWCVPARLSDHAFRALCSGLRLRRERAALALTSRPPRSNAAELANRS
ncbi:MAG: polysaccharide deacetylase family protein [bacterium]|nr:polysaccharide deacetylase family protein [bacterium]